MMLIKQSYYTFDFCLSCMASGYFYIYTNYFVIMIYCIICGKYRKFEKPKISYLLEKTLILSIICSKCKNEDELRY